MRIVLVSSVTLTGENEARATGIGIYVKELSGELNKMDIPVTLVTGTASNESQADPKNEGLLEIIPVSGRSVGSNLGFILKLMLKIRKLKLDKNCIVHAQRPELLLPFTLLKPRIPRICTLHGSAYKSVSMKHSRFYTGLYKRIEGFCLKRASVIISVDKYTRNEYKERYVYLSDTIHIIPTGLDLNKFKPKPVRKLREKYDLPGDPPVIMYAGRLEREKRVELLLNAFKILSKKYGEKKDRPHLLIVGDGRQRKDLKKLASDMKLNNVKFMGAQPHDRIPDIMNCADVFVLVSAFEGSPTVVKEALACGVPVVATRTGNTAEVIKPGETGELVPVSAGADEIAKKIDSVLAAIAGGDITRETCAGSVSAFGWTKIAKKIVGIYNEVR